VNCHVGHAPARLAFQESEARIYMMPWPKDNNANAHYSCVSTARSHNLLTCTTICLDVIARWTVASLAGTAVRALCVVADSVWTAGVGIIGALVHICIICAQDLNM
jgi:hypothetical protein